MRREHILNGTQVHWRALCIFSFTPRGDLVVSSPTGMFLGAGQKPENLKETSTGVKLHTESNLNSGLNWGPGAVRKQCCSMCHLWMNDWLFWLNQYIISVCKFTSALFVSLFPQESQAPVIPAVCVDAPGAPCPVERGPSGTHLSSLAAVLRHFPRVGGSMCSLRRTMSWTGHQMAHCPLAFLFTYCLYLFSCLTLNLLLNIF